ncbi:MAG: DUF1501 domain-containing protein [Pirellulales bacterium]|nr:DUF1501 domain-containing protein [Pirellulales bacterium]
MGNESDLTTQRLAELRLGSNQHTTGARASTDSSRIPRRRLLQIGGLGALGLNLSTLLAAGERRARGADPTSNGATAVAAAPSGKPIRSCILVFLYGGPSHLDTWDLKPDAPREVRGQFAPIATTVPGLPVAEHLPHCAKVMEHLAIVRSVHHPMRNHNSAAVEALSGRTPLRGDLELLANDPATDFPCYGSALAHSLPGAPLVPPYVALPHIMYNVVMLPGQTAGFLGAAHEPLRVLADPNRSDFRVPELSLPNSLSLADLDARQRLLDCIDAQSRQLGAVEATQRVDAFYQRAFSLLHSREVRHALDLGGEDARTRDRYGRTRFGQSLLLARRLVEAGVRFVSVYDHVTNGLDNWDTHVDNFGRLRDQLLPPSDRGFAALVSDLLQGGLLDDTLVVWIGEFGRTPQINASGGRDHWPDCFSVVLSGGGVRGGTTYGASDKIGAYPALDPVSMGDLAATLFWRFGLDPESVIHDGSGRPYRLAEGTPLRRLFA